MPAAVLEPPEAKAAVAVDHPATVDLAEDWTWEVAWLYPRQGEWTEEAYMEVSERVNRHVELSDGILEVHALPTPEHQATVLVTRDRVKEHVLPRKLGVVLTAPMPVRLWEGKVREPDVMFMLAEHRDRRGPQRWEGADWVAEVVSPESVKRDTLEKRGEYARAGVREYWLIDPDARRVTVLVLREGVYEVDGEYGPADRVVSRLLEGFEVDLAGFWAEVEAMG